MLLATFCEDSTMSQQKKLSFFVIQLRAKLACYCGASRGVRIPNLQFRRLTLYPVELWTHEAFFNASFIISRFL